MPDAVLSLHHLTKHFGSVVAVDDLSESIAQGEYFCILGPSGCGKTTLLRLIGGFEEPSAGELRLGNQPLNGVPPEKRDVNIVFQSYALFPHMTVRENVAFGLQARRESRDVIHSRVGEALELVRLTAQADRLPRQLSGGQQQRVALARALVMQPRVLLLDEPLSALDRHLRLAMQEELRRLHTQTGLTFVHITHDQSEALALGNRVAVMRAGRFVQVAAPSELYRRPRTRFVAEFVGASNIVHGWLGDGVLASIRPEAIRISNEPGVDGFPATIMSTAFLGPIVELQLDTARGRLTAHLPAHDGGAQHSPGEQVHASVAAADIHALQSDD